MRGVRRTSGLHALGACVVVAATCATLTLIGTATAGAAPTTWSSTTLPWSTPSPADPSGTAISCTSATSCVAVANTTSLPIIETLSGTTWTMGTASLTPGDGGSLDGVTCLSSTSCLAVGDESDGTVEVSLLETLAAGVWTDAVLPAPAGLVNPELSAITCSSATSCVAVGSAYQSVGSGDAFASATVPYADVLSGTTWTASQLPTPANSISPTLTALSCPAATTCVAVGVYQDADGNEQSFIETLSGTTSSDQVVAPIKGWFGAQVGGISCTSATSCELVGSAFVNRNSATRSRSSAS